MAERTRQILDYTERTVRLTGERLRHIHEHPEMIGQERRIGEVLKSPDGGRRLCNYRLLYGRSERSEANMAKRRARLKVWFDEEGDFLEVAFAKRKGSFRSIGPDIYERVDAKGNVIGFAIFNFMKHDRKTVEIPLAQARLAVGP